MNRIINNFVDPSKDLEFKLNELYPNKEIITRDKIKICRYCWEEDDCEYISPCLCKGGVKYIHTDCLNQWRETHVGDIEKKNTCEICKYKYIFKKHNNDYTKYSININIYYII